MIAARRDYAPYAEIRKEAATDMYEGGLPVKGNYHQFSIDEPDESVREADIGEQNEKRRVEYASREEGGMEFSGYTAMTNIKHLEDGEHYEWGGYVPYLNFDWSATKDEPAKMNAEVFDIGFPSTSFQPINSVSESVALPGEEVSAQKRVMVSTRTGPQEARVSRTQTENSGASHEVDVGISSLQRQIVRSNLAEGEIDNRALGNIRVQDIWSPYFNVWLGELEPGTILGEEILGVGATPVTLEWIKESGTISSFSAGFTVEGKEKSVPNWYYERTTNWKESLLSGVVCQCSARVADSTLGIIMYCPNSATEEKQGAQTSVILSPGGIWYGHNINDGTPLPKFKYPEGNEPTSVDGEKLLGRKNINEMAEEGNTGLWWNGGDWQTRYEIIDVQGGTGNIAFPESASRYYEGAEKLFVSFTLIKYCFPYQNEGGGVSEFRVGPVAGYISSYSPGRISAYTIAQAGNTTGTADGNRLLRQAKEIFPSRILRISAHTETDAGCRSMNGLSTSNLNAECIGGERSVSAIPRALITTTHDCSSRIMASFAVDTNVSSYLSLPSAVSASVIHDDGGGIYASFYLMGTGISEEQFWPGQDFGYVSEDYIMEYYDQEGKSNIFVGLMSALGINSQPQLPTYVVRGAVNGSSRSTLFSQTAYLFRDVRGGVG